MNHLSNDEWRFADCPKDQRRWCEIYEYARENQTVRKMVDSYRNTRVWDDPGLFPDRCSNLIGKTFIDAFHDYFPAQPFLSIPSDLREKRCAELNKLRNHMALRVHQPGGQYTTSKKTWSVELHPRTPRRLAIAAVDAVLKELRGGQRTMSRLNYLAVDRLYRHLKNAERVLNYAQAHNADLPGDDETAVSRARRKAKSLVEDVLDRIL